MGTCWIYKGKLFSTLSFVTELCLKLKALKVSCYSVSLNDHGQICWLSLNYIKEMDNQKDYYKRNLYLNGLVFTMVLRVLIK